MFPLPLKGRLNLRGKALVMSMIEAADKHRIFWRELPPENISLIHQNKSFEFIHSMTRYLKAVPRTIPVDKLMSLNPVNQFVTDEVESGELQLEGGFDGLKPAQGNVEVMESEARVNELFVNNNSDGLVILPGGTIFQGGWQDRAATGSRVLKKGFTRLPVYCVEAGRWSGENVYFNRFSQLPYLIDYYLQADETLNVDASSSKETSAEMRRGLNNRSTYYFDKRAGLSVLSVFPNSSFLPAARHSVNVNRSWARHLFHNATGRVQCFRIFDASSQVAMVCLRDGTGIKDMHGKYLMFRYKDRDLANVLPPDRELPVMKPLSLGATDGFETLEDFMQASSECRVFIASRLSDDLYTFFVYHPSLAMVGKGLLFRKQIAYMSLISFRAFGARQS